MFIRYIWLKFVDLDVNSFNAREGGLDVHLLYLANVFKVYSCMLAIAMVGMASRKGIKHYGA